MRFLIRALLFSTFMAAVGGTLLAQHGAGTHTGSQANSGVAAHSYSERNAPVAGTTGLRAPVAGYTGLHSPAAGYTGIRPGALRSRRDYRRVPYAYFFNPYYYPFLDYSSAPYGGSPYDVPDDPEAEAAIMAQNALGEQVQRLSAQVDQLTSNQQAQQQASSYPQPVAQQTPPVPPIMLVLRTGQKLEVQNYAVMGETFWDFTRTPARKIPISSIDIAGSTRATQAKGGEFPQLEPAE